MTRRRRRALISLFLLAAALAASAPVAEAKARFGRCPQNPFARCAKVKVPLDRSGRTPGTITIYVEKVRGQRSRGALFALAGGPGQAATGAFGEDLFETFDPALRSRDLITFDQRGTGRSGVLRCPGFERALLRQQLDREPAEAEACARRIGPKRRHYTTKESVDDLEAVRRAVGVRRISILGVSYGVKVALAYAMKYPRNVERLVLDSVQEVEGPDPLYRDSFRAIPRALGALCRGGACASFTADPAADVAELVRQLGPGRLSGPVYDAKGRPRTKRFGRIDLFFLLLAGDFDPGLRAATPAAVRAALRGDNAPILRLSKPALGAARAQPKEFSEALFATTLCEEAPMPWPRAAPVGERPAQAAAAVEALPESDFYPFDRATALETEFIRICSRWPTAPEEPALTGAPPNVPALLLAGEDDLRTPLEEAQRVAARLPRAALVEVQAAGHSVTSIGDRCVIRSVQGFFAGRRPPALCRRTRIDKPLRLPPLSLAEVPPAPRTSGKAGSTVAATAMTVADVDRMTNVFERGGGLRGGRYGYSEGVLKLVRVQYVPDVEVSGTVDFDDRGKLFGRLRVGGAAAARGDLRLHASGRVTGRLDGERIDARVDLQKAPLAARLRPLPPF